MISVFSNLHDEIKTEIFSRVPAKTIGRFKCLSKTWYANLSTPHFLDLHLSRKNHQQSLLLLNLDNSIHIINPPIENPTISKELELHRISTKFFFRHINNYWVDVMGSCNGIVLLLDFRREMNLVNPITFEQFKVPRLTFELSNIHHAVPLLHGFGYDSSSHDYKIIVIYALFLGNVKTCLKSGKNVNTSAELYSVKSGVWKNVNTSLYQFVCSHNSCGVFMNGSIHWYDNHKKESKILKKIIAFNLSTEVFHEVDIPSNVSRGFRLFAQEGRLCALNPLWMDESDALDGKIDLWMMKEYGIVNSWTKLASIDGDMDLYMHVPLYFSRDEDILLVMTAKGMVLFNIHEGTVKDMVVDGVLASFYEGCSFVGSLVSLKGMISSN